MTDEREDTVTVPEHTDTETLRLAARRTRRSFFVGGIAALAGFAGWRWLVGRRSEDDLPWPLRRTLENNEQLARDYFRARRNAAEFPAARASDPKVNGTEGLSDDFEPAGWRLAVEGVDSDEGSLELTAADLKDLPRAGHVTELKCIEGWRHIVHWEGVRFADFVAKYPPAPREDDSADDPAARAEYVALETPDGGYYVGLDMASALHPQTLLCDTMNGRPLSSSHGGPLRLVIPVKYGIKNIKRIGRIRYTNTRPRDYWAERGYDWFAGL